MEAPEKRSKPKPFRWCFNGSGVVEFYDFQLWKRSDPPEYDAEPVLLKFPQ